VCEIYSQTQPSSARLGAKYIAKPHPLQLGWAEEYIAKPNPLLLGWVEETQPFASRLVRRIYSQTQHSQARR
jgi:hypothetical protein